MALVPLALLGALPLFAAPAVATASGPSAGDESASYPLDGVPRVVSPKGRVECPSLPMVRYRGKHIRYHKPVLVYRGFREHLERFEEIVAETAVEVYGRKPRRIRHLGTYNCRRIRKYPEWLSEHALGNAIDVEGFDFGRARKGERKAAPHRRLRRGFRVRVKRHWERKRGVAAIHARFLRELTERLVAEKNLFRVLLGPAFPGHRDHFHFDMSPYEMVTL